MASLTHSRVGYRLVGRIQGLWDEAAAAAVNH